ncbi:MAG TPA: putative porin [Bacteroidia bacterium]|jgi:hypothetical protein|nr:putative porin [Bacteroidia bacterium]
MKARLYLFFSVLLLLAAQPSLADKNDTVRAKYKTPLTYSFTESMLAPGNIWAQYGWQNMHTTDTTLNNFQIYTTHYNLGNTGLPYVPVLFSNALQPMGFFYGEDYVNYNFYTDSSVRYFNTRAPFTQFYYISDPQIHQFFRFTHAQNFGKKLDVAIGFKRIRSEGNYLNQSTNMNQVTIDANYHTKHYLAYADIIYDVHKFQQNGGTDTNIANPLYSNRLAVPVNLNFATSEIFEQSFHLQQYYFLGFRNTDSLKENPLLYIGYSFKIMGHSNVFTDNSTADSFLYAPPLHEFISPLMYDSTRYTEINNDLSIGSGKGSTKVLRWDAGLRDQWVHFRNYIGTFANNIYGAEQLSSMYNYADIFYNNLLAHAHVYNAFDSGKIIFDASGQYIVAGNQQGDEQAVIQVGFKIDSSRFLKLSGSYANQLPPFIYQLYQGNNIQWMRSLANTATSNITLNYYDRKWKLGITLSATQMTNMVYFDTNALPVQYFHSFMVYNAGITKDFKLSKFHLTTSEKLQYVADSVPMRLPRLVTENSLFFETYLFHHALLLRFGVDLYYNTAYLGYAYMPVTNQYYLENSTKFGNYIYVDPFVSFRIKTFRMFVKLENATEGVNNSYNYYYALHYPMPDRTLRFGINWDFWN